MEGLTAIIEAAREANFTPEYREQASDEQVLGMILAHHFQWNGEAVLHACMYGLEDANYHSVNAKLKETFPELTEGANV